MHLVSIIVFAAVLAFAKAGIYESAPVVEYAAPPPPAARVEYGPPQVVYSAPPPPPPQPEIIEVARRYTVRRPVVRYQTRVIKEPIVEYQEEERIVKTPQVVYRPRPAYRYGERPTYF